MHRSLLKPKPYHTAGRVQGLSSFNPDHLGRVVHNSINILLPDVLRFRLPGAVAATETGLYQGRNRQCHNTGSCHGAAAATNPPPAAPSTAVCCCKQLRQLAAAWSILPKSTMHREMLLCRWPFCEGSGLGQTQPFHEQPWQHMQLRSSSRPAGFNTHNGQTDVAEAHIYRHIHSRRHTQTAPDLSVANAVCRLLLTPVIS